MKSVRQLVRYGIVGLSSNIALYVGYLAITSLGVGHKSAMSGLYVVGMVVTFMLNRAWTFGFRGGISGSFTRYLIAFGIGYLVNLVGLYALVDVVGIAHQLAQAAMIIVVAALLFLLQRQWVFRHAPNAEGVAP